MLPTFAFLLGIYSLLFPKALASSSLEGLFHFVDAQATSTNPGTNPSEFSPKRALQPGTGYWCSEGNHADDAVVTWVGTLNSKTTLKGLKIRWAYSPKEVQVSVASGAGSEHVVLNWRRTPSTDQAFDEDLFFEKPDLAETVKISMRGASNNYFGITQVTPVASAQPIGMIVSGITSPSGEMCLQVSNGDLDQDFAHLVLDSCAYAIAAGDGRELFRQNGKGQIELIATKPAKCLTLQSANTTDGGQIVIQDCLAALSNADGRSNWEFKDNAQLVMEGRNSKFCLSQKGTVAGFVNVLKVQGVKVTASSNSDSSHAPANAVDGDMTTWWGSGGFGDSNEHLVLFDIDIGKPAKINKVRIDWEYPPFAYAVSVSNDGAAFAEVASSKANPANATTDGVSDKIARYVRISLQRPHPRYGKVKTKFIYGIRDIQVLTNRLQTIVQDRVDAANTADARDKYFFDPVREFDPVLSTKLHTMEADLEGRIQGIQMAAVEVQDLMPKMQSCAQSMDAYDKRMSETEEAIGATKKKMSDLNAGDMALISKQLASGLTLGDTKALAAADCYVIKNRNPSATSGFYWVNPRCGSQPFRAWCDMETGTMFYFWNGNPSKKPGTSIRALVTSIDDVRLHCAEMGLEPLILQNRQQVKQISTAMTKMGFDLTSKKAVPLAYDPQCRSGRCSGTFRDMMGGNDITSILMEAATPESAKSALSGLDTGGVGLGQRTAVFFDLGSEDVAAIVCSTNTLLTDQGASHVDIECNAQARNNPIFQGLPDTNLIVDCPPGCEEDTTLAVYGGGSVYHEASSICRAAIHAGVTTHGGLVNIALENTRDRFEGSTENGIQSKPLEVDDGSRTIRVGPVPKDCPIDMVEEAPSSSSFLQISSRIKHPQPPKPLNVSPKRIANIQPHDHHTENKKSHDVSDKNQFDFARMSFLQISDAPVKLSEPKVPVEVNEILTKMYTMIDEAHGVDPHLIALTQESADETVGDARAVLKPAEQMQLQQGRRAIELFGHTEDVSETLYQTTGASYSELDELTKQLEVLATKRTQQRGFSSWKFNYDRDTMPNTWEAGVSFGTSGKGDWSYKPSSGGHTRVVALSSAITRETGAIGNGAFVMSKNRRFYDFIFTTKIRISDGPIAGVAFRMRDFQNMYMIELDRSNGGSRRLIRVYKGLATVLCEKHDGGYIPDIWYKIHVDTSHGRIRICIGEEGGELEEVFDLQDETFMAGAVGLFASETSNVEPVEWDEIEVEAKDCTPQGCLNSHPPPPPECNTMTDAYFSRFNAFYSIMDGIDAKNGPSKWSYVKEEGGRPRSLIQESPISVQTGVGTMAVVKGPKSCPHGLLSVEFYTQCTSGAVGIVFRYRNNDDYYLLEVTPQDMQLRKKVGEKFISVPSASPPIGGFDSSMWNTLSIFFNGPLIKVSLSSTKNQKGGEDIIYQTSSFGSPDSRYAKPGEYRVGLGTTNCPNTLFDAFKMGPIDLMKATDTQNSPAMFEEVERAIFALDPPGTPWQACQAAKTFLERQELCKRLFGTDATLAGKCSADFCPTCCDFHTSFRPKQDRAFCAARCRQHDHFSNVTHTAWVDSLVQCVGRPKSSHTMDSCYRWVNITKNTPGEDSMQCHRDSCQACCQTFPAFDIIVDHHAQKLANCSNLHTFASSAHAMEISSCQAFCRSKYTNK